jgi:hypothetical protein
VSAGPAPRRLLPAFALCALLVLLLSIGGLAHRAGRR